VTARLQRFVFEGDLVQGHAVLEVLQRHAQDSEGDVTDPHTGRPMGLMGPKQILDTVSTALDWTGTARRPGMGWGGETVSSGACDGRDARRRRTTHNANPLARDCGLK